jgi:hypothetical protein
MTHRTWRGFARTALLLIAAGCAPDENATTDDGGTDGRDGDVPRDVVPDTDVPVSCAPGAVQCAGDNVQTCRADGSGWGDPVPCADPTPACTEGIGCTACAGGEGICTGDVARLCMPDGSGWYADDPCDVAAGERCDGGWCTDLTGPCEEARRGRSYEGCDYFVTVTANSTMLAPEIFRYAVVVGNRNAVLADVRVYDGDVEIASASVTPNGTASIDLPWKPDLRRPNGSRIVPGGAYRLRSDLPVTVYQFNPLRYWEESRPIYPGSYTNDASLVLPRNVLTGRYVGVARETFKKIELDTEGHEQVTPIPGFLAIVGTRNDTTVTVTFSAHTQGVGIAAHAPGETDTFTLQRGDVLQILSRIPDGCDGTNWQGNTHYCQVGPAYDLTGSLVVADKPVALFGGHDCTFVPYDRWACDHLEEQVFPVEALGRRYVGGRTESVAGEGNLWRVVSAADGNTVTFTPAGIHAPVTLGRGEYREFEAGADFLAEGTGPFLLAQYLLGEGDDRSSIGDPSMGLAVPIDQFRREYNFLSPEDYQDVAPRQRGQNWITVIAPDGALVSLDGAEHADFAPIGATGYGTLRLQVPGGSHSLTSLEKIGVTCYGYGNYTSYLYPGGLDVEPINPVILL